MFGKKSHVSNSDKFIMGMGKKVGNLTGRGTKPPTPAVAKVASKQSTLPSADSMKKGVKVNQNKPLPLGKANTFNTTRKV